MFPNITRKAVVTTLAIPMMLMSQGCTDEEMGAVLGGVAIVAGAVAIGAAIDDDGHHRDRDRYDRDRYDRHDRHRGGDYGRSHDRGRGRGHSRHHYLAPSIDGVAPAGALEAGAQKVALKYSIPMVSAERLTTALQAAHTGDLQPVYALGLTNQDFSRLAKMEMITLDGVNKLAESLQLHSVQTRVLIRNIMADVKDQAQDSTSPYWHSCFQAASWKTPEAGVCEDASAPGCSPETGATLCAAN